MQFHFSFNAAENGTLATLRVAPAVSVYRKHGGGVKRDALPLSRLTCEEAEGAAGPLVQVHVVGVDVADQDAVVVVVQVVSSEHIKVPPHGHHDMIDSPLQHGAAGQPLVLKRRGRRQRDG